ncbi:MAG: class I SAM-dependent methyltransferase [Pseudonocardiaceae bacterium]
MNEPTVNAATRWAAGLASWAIPTHILAAAPESPWGYPSQLYVDAAHTAMTEDTPSRRAAANALPTSGTVLDVGCGAGAASFPLTDRAERIIGVDASKEMLVAFAAGADRLGADHEQICGQWPAVESESPIADVVVCHHVLYNIAAIVPFAQALDRHAQRRVVVEITDQHPQSTLNSMWLHFHGLVRPDTPTAAVLIETLRDEGFDLSVERFTRPSRLAAQDPAAAVAFARRRLCLPAERDPEVAEMLFTLKEHAQSQLVTLFWPSSGVAGAK